MPAYLSLSEAVPQLERVNITNHADLIALVKPRFELRLGAPPADSRLAEALARATQAMTACGWRVLDWLESPLRGARRSSELFVHARRGRQANHASYP